MQLYVKERKKLKNVKKGQEEPIHEYQMPEDLKRRILALPDLFAPLASLKRYRVVDFMLEESRADALQVAKTLCDDIFLYLNKLKGSVVYGKKGARYDIFHPGFIHAPPHTLPGTMHFDMDFAKSHKSYTVWIPISEVTEANGYVTMLEKSCGIPVDTNDHCVLKILWLESFWVNLGKFFYMMVVFIIAVKPTQLMMFEASSHLA